KSASFSRGVAVGIDSLLHVTASFFQNFSHRTRHDASDLFLTLAQKLADTIKHLAPFGGRNEAPFCKGMQNGASFRPPNGARCFIVSASFCASVRKRSLAS